MHLFFSAVQAASVLESTETSDRRQDSRGICFHGESRRKGYRGHGHITVCSLVVWYCTKTSQNNNIHISKHGGADRTYPLHRTWTRANSPQRNTRSSSSVIRASVEVNGRWSEYSHTGNVMWPFQHITAGRLELLFPGRGLDSYLFRWLTAHMSLNEREFTNCKNESKWSVSWNIRNRRVTD